MQKLLPKKELNDFIKSLLKKYEIIAPISQNNNRLTKFKSIEDSKELANLYLDNHTEFYPLLDNDLSSFALDLNTTNVEFIKTINPAIFDNLNGTIKQSITVKLNESLIVVYNNPQEGYLVYFSHFAGAKLLDFYVNDGSSIIKLKEGIDYTLDSDKVILKKFSFPTRRTNAISTLVEEKFMVFEL